MTDPVAIVASDLTVGERLSDVLLGLNNAHAQALSWMEPERLQSLVARAFAAWRIGEVDAFLLAFDQDAVYDSPNFLWFRARYERFVYVDRVVVAPQARGRGYARRLYLALCSKALRAGHDRLVCEVNLEPPNPASDAFHAAVGFVKVGQGSPFGGSKTVRYLARHLSSSIAAGNSPM